jgi:hypothetical protein
MTDKIGPGHVCPHGIRWPWVCDPCDEAAWEQHKRDNQPPPTRSQPSPAV